MGELGKKSEKKGPKAGATEGPPLVRVALSVRDVECHTKKGGVVIGAMTWPDDQLDDGRITVGDFCASIKLVRDTAGTKSQADLILCAGAKIQQGTSTDLLVAKSVWKASGRPILFEMPATDGRKRWVLVDGGALIDVRWAQHVFDDEDVEVGSAGTVGELNSGGGVIHLMRDGVVTRRCVLLLCAEANILKRKFTRRHSVIAGGFGKSVKPPGVFCGDWVLLHPAHHPYWPHIGHKGFCLVGEMRVKGGGDSVPLFRQLVSRSRDDKYSDGSKPPIAVIHAAPFHRGVDRRERPDEDFATMHFTRHRTRSKHLVRLRSRDGVMARYAEFEA